LVPSALVEALTLAALPEPEVRWESPELWGRWLGPQMLQEQVRCQAPH